MKRKLQQTYMGFGKAGSLIITCLSIFFIFSCEIINPAEDIPSFIRIDTFKVNITSDAQGSASHNLIDVWVSIDGNKAGMYELPVLFPILKTGEVNIVLRPGYKVDDQLLSRDPHPFYNPYIIDTILVEDNILHIEPTIKYKEECDFLFVEDFERTGFRLDTSTGDVSIMLVKNDVGEGRYAGGIFLEEDFSTFEGITPTLEVPNFPRPILLEFFYKNNYDFEVGFYTNVSPYVLIAHLYPRENWDKISINIYDLLKNYQNAKQFKIAFRSTIVNFDLNPEIFLDNIKIITINE